MPPRGREHLNSQNVKDDAFYFLKTSHFKNEKKEMRGKRCVGKISDFRALTICRSKFNLGDVNCVLLCFGFFTTLKE